LAGPPAGVQATSQVGSGTGVVTIEGRTETVSHDSRALTLMPWELFRAWLLGGPVYGLLGSTTTLGDWLSHAAELVSRV